MSKARVIKFDKHGDPSSRADKVEPLKRYGARHAFVTGDDDWREEIVRQCSGEGPRIILDAVGEKLVPDLIGVIRPRGVLVNYGALSGGTFAIAAFAAIRNLFNQ